MAAYRRVYDSRHLQDDCQEPGSAPEPYARQWSTGYLYLFKKTLIGSRIQRTYIFKIRDFVLERKSVRNSHRLVICAQAAMHVLDSDV